MHVHGFVFINARVKVTCTMQRSRLSARCLSISIVSGGGDVIKHESALETMLIYVWPMSRRKKGKSSFYVGINIDR